MTLPVLTRNGYDFKGWKAEGRAAPANPIYSISADTKFNSDFELAEPFTRIYTKADLEAITSSTATLSASYKLMNDINLEGTNWTPIGSNTTENQFTGVFEGSGNTIKGLSIDDPSNNYVGLFGYISGGARIANLTVEITGSGIKGRQNTAGIVGYAVGVNESNPAKIVNTHVKAASGQTPLLSSVGNYTGGIIGATGNFVTVINCSNGVSVESNGHAGGIAGYTAANSKIYNSRNTGAITGNYLSTSDINVGGIVGNVYGSGGTGTLITDSYNTGAVTATSRGNANAGGIAGNIYAYISISGSYNTGAVSANTEAITLGGYGYIAYAGGIAGHIRYASGTVSKNYNTGDVSAASTATAPGTTTRPVYAAGIVGYLQSVNGTGTFSISNNAAANSSVTGNTSSATKRVNRVVGYSDVDLSYITGNIALDTMAGSFENESAYLGTDKTELELKSQATYEVLGWLFGNDADNPWTMPYPGTDYPRLYWE
jgi:hypothetical protein